MLAGYDTGQRKVLTHSALPLAERRTAAGRSAGLKMNDLLQVVHFARGYEALAAEPVAPDLVIATPALMKDIGA